MQVARELLIQLAQELTKVKVILHILSPVVGLVKLRGAQGVLGEGRRGHKKSCTSLLIF